MLDNSTTSFAKGLAAEKRAQDYLIQKGYLLLAHRYKTKFGELDLVMHQGHKLFFFEVKQRPTLAQGLECITLKHRQRLWQAGEHFLHNACNEFPWDTVQFDLIVVLPCCTITHMGNVLSSE
jgi:putative endonuclease